ncbi:MAG: PAS domain S-box protein [Myxococcales bacterium]|nr:PAS domain S-box protein [Myxococcales bacterium]
MRDETALREALRRLLGALAQGASKGCISTAVAEDLGARFGFSHVCLVDEAQRVVGGEPPVAPALLACAVRERRVVGEGNAVAVPFRGGAMLVDRPALSLSDPVVPLLEELADALGETLGAVVGRRPSVDPFRELSTHLQGGLAHCRMFFEGDRPVDWVYLWVNEAFGQQTGLRDVVGRRVSEVIPGLPERDPELLQIYGCVARTRVPERFERHVRSLDMWFAVSVFSPAPLEFVAVFEVVDEARRIENRLRESEQERQRMTEALAASERRHRALFERAGIGMAQVDFASERFLAVNAQMARLLGYPRDELVGRTWASITHPDDVAADRVAVAALREGRDGVTREKRYLRADGSAVWARVTVSRLDGAGGAPGTGVVMVEDLSERRANEAALRLHVSAFQAAANAVVITDRDGTIEFVNAAFAALTGHDEHEVVGQNIRILDSGHESREFHRAMWQTILGGQVWRGEFVNRRKDGTLYREEMTITPLFEDGEVRHFIGIKQDVTAHKRVEDDLRLSEDRYRSLVDDLEDFVLSTEASGAITFANRAVSAFGHRPEALLGRTVDELVHADDRPIVAQLRESRLPRELRLLDAAGKTRFVRMFVRPQMVGDDCVGRTWVGVDLTARRETEDQLRVAQKMEAIGRLAGGVAHDFNNLLSVILSYTDLAIADLRAEDPLRADLVEVLEAGKRAESLTRQLLTFSRRQMMTVESIELDALVRGLTKMVGRLIGEDVELTIVASDGSHPTRADRGQIEQVVMNLVVNARDAMPDGGDLRISTTDVVLDGVRAETLEVKPGAYVELAVADTGCGMDDATRERVFEPFFTTKALGKGTGLGLSTVYGIVRQSGGAVAVESVVGRGSVFRVYLPRDAGTMPVDATVSASVSPHTGHESILVVEDEPALRALVRRVLTASGYDVHVAANAGEALLICERLGAEVRLVLTDVIMPGMNGSELARRLAPLCPAAPVIFMSGYTDDEIARHHVLDEHFLRKPFDWRTLTRQVREALDRP